MPTQATSSTGGEGVDVATRIVEGIATADKADPLEMPPLFDVVDTDALEALVANGSADVEVVFEYAGYEVTIGGDRRVHLEPVDGEGAVVP